MIDNILVFIIDDDLVQNEIHELILVKSVPGIEVKSFTNSAKALNYLEKGVLPDLIFLDIHIPGESETAFLEKFKSKGLESDIFLMSSMPFLENQSLYNEFPAVKDFITKPLLENKIKHLFNHYA